MELKGLNHPNLALIQDATTVTILSLSYYHLMIPIQQLNSYLIWNS